MIDTALNHLSLVVAIVALLIAHMLRLDVCVSSVKKRAHLPHTFAHREMDGELVLVDPDGRRSSRRGR